MKRITHSVMTALFFLMCLWPTLAHAQEKSELQRAVNRAEKRLGQLKDELESRNGMTRKEFCKELERINKDIREDRDAAPADDPGRDAADAAVNGTDILLGLKGEGEITGRFTAANHIKSILELIDRAQKEW